MTSETIGLISVFASFIITAAGVALNFILRGDKRKVDRVDIIERQDEIIRKLQVEKEGYRSGLETLRQEFDGKIAKKEQENLDREQGIIARLGTQLRLYEIKYDETHRALLRVEKSFKLLLENRNDNVRLLEKLGGSPIPLPRVDAL